MSDIQRIDDRSSKELVKPAYLSKHSYKFETRSGLLQKEKFQISEDEINSSLKQNLHFRYFRFSHIHFTEKCELVIAPKKPSQIPYSMLEYDLYENNSIRIFGLKGTGKTTLVKKLLSEAFDHITARYVFYFDCNEIDLNNETTLLEFLAENIYINSRQKTLDYEIMKTLEHSNTVTIVIDDAMSIKSKEDYRMSYEDNYDSFTDLKQINLTNTGHNHLSKILNGEIMRKSIKIVTCLLNAPMHSFLRYSKLDDENILLVGLNHDSQLEIIKSVCEKNQQNVEKHFQNYPGLLDFCYMPDICFLTGHCINEHFTSSTLQTSLPISSTDIFVYLLDKLVSDSSLFDFNLLTEICKLSWHGIINHKTEFDLTNLRKMSLNWQYLKNLSANINKATLFLFKFSSPNTFHFTISLAQEFCAAIHLIFMMPFDEFKMLISTKSKLQIFDLYNYQNKHITRFMFGLCNDVTFKSLHKINFLFLHSTDKMSLLCNTVSDVNSQIKTLDNTFLQNLAWVYELHNHSYTQKLASRLSNEIEVHCQFCHEDISAFFYILQARHEPVTITALSKDNFIDDSWELFFTLARSSSIKMLSLDLSWNKFGNEGAGILSQCLINVKQLILQDCDITAPGVEAISNKICELDEPMLSLDLSWNQFGNKGAGILSQCLINVKQLILQGCDITAPGVEAISNKICELHDPMLSLDLSWNKFGNEGAGILSQCLNNVKQLILQGCDITAPGVESISNKICELDEPMEFVNLDDNKVGNRGITAISSCLHMIVKLEIGDYDDSELTMKGIKKILSAAENTPYPLLELKINCGYSMEEEAKREAQTYHSNIWIQNNQVLFKVENVNERAKHLSELMQQVQSDLLSIESTDENYDEEKYFSREETNSDYSSSNVLIDEIDGEEKYSTYEETNSDCFSSDDSSELFETAQAFPDQNLLSLKDLLSIESTDENYDEEKYFSPEETNSDYVVGANFGENSSLMLGEEIKNILACSLLIKLKRIDYSKTLLNDEKVEQISNLIIDGVEEINLQDCRLTASQVVMITSQISKLTKPIEHLKLEGNKVGNGGFTAVSSCLHNIVKLEIGDYDDSELTMEGIKTILSAGEKTSIPLQKLKIFCRPSIYEQAKKEAQEYHSNIWINDTQVPFKVESVKKSEENLTEYKKQVKSVDEGISGGRLSTNDEMKELWDDSIVPTELAKFADSRGSSYTTLDCTSISIGPDRPRSSSTSGNDDVEFKKSIPHSRFFVSFMVDARGATMRASRHPDLRILIPPKACRGPTRVICKLAQHRHKTALPSPVQPPLCDGEGKACKVVEVGPSGESFLEPVAIELPYFANVLDNNRQLVVLQSHDGELWRPHEEPCSDQDFINFFKDEDLDTAEELASRKVMRIITTSFPRYFAVVSRPIEDPLCIGSEDDIALKTEKASKPDETIKPTKNYSKQTMLLKNHLRKEGKRHSEQYLPQYIQTKSPSSENVSKSLIGKYFSTRDNCSYPLNFIGDEITDILFHSEPERTFKRKSNNELQKDLNVFIGNAGSGKTSLFKTFLKEYSEKENFCGFDFLFFIDYNYVDLDSQITPLEFLVKNLPHSWIKDMETTSTVVKEMETKGKVCIAIDNFDCMKSSFLNSASIHSKEKTTGKVIAQQILTGNFLPNAKVLITLRPFQFYEFLHFSSKCKPFSTVLVTGVNETGLKTIYKHINENHFIEVLTYIQTYSDLKCFCIVPTNCIAVMQVLSTYISEQTGFVDDTPTETAEHTKWKPLFSLPLTSVVLPLILLKLSSHGLNPDECNLIELAKFLGKDVFNRSFYVREDYEKLREQFGEVVDVFLQVCEPTSDKNEFSIKFSNLMFGFYSAVNIYFLYEPFEIEQKLNNFSELSKESNFQIAVRFLFGFCNKTVQEYLNELFPEQPIPNNSSGVLQKILRSKLDIYSAGKMNSFSYILLICSLVFEMQDENLAGEIAESFPDQISSKTVIKINELTGLTYVLSKRQKNDISLTLAFENEKCFELAKNFVAYKTSYVKFLWFKDM